MKRDPSIPVALSYSSSLALFSCERKFVHQYVWKTTPDLDYVEPDFFNFGSAVHEVLEVTGHDHCKYKPELVDQVVRKFKLDPIYDKAKVLACLRGYWSLHERSNCKVRACELWMENDLARMKLDAIFVDTRTNGEFWWIGEIKTPAKLDPVKPVMLPYDNQINIYAAFVDCISEKLGLDPARFLGIRYREIQKPGERAKKQPETFEEFHARLSPVTTREIVIPKHKLQWESVYDNFLLAVKRARKIQETANTKGIDFCHRGTNECLGKYGNEPCKFFSQCYGKTYTDTVESENINTVEPNGIPVSEGKPADDLTELF